MIIDRLSTYATQGITQVSYDHRSPSTYATQGITQVSYQHRSISEYATQGITQVTYNHRSPLQYDHRSPLTYDRPISVYISDSRYYTSVIFNTGPLSTYATQGITQVSYNIDRHRLMQHKVER